MASLKARKLFGIYVPPKSPPKIKSGALTLTFVIRGHIPSKKNNQTVRRCFDSSVEFLKQEIDTKQSLDGKKAFEIAMKAINKVYIGYIGNKEYTSFVEEQKPKLIEQAAHYSERLKHRNLIFPLDYASLGINFFWAKDYNHDTLNKAQSIQDLLVDAHIIKDDNYKIINPVTLHSEFAKDWVIDNTVKINITIN